MPDIGTAGVVVALVVVLVGAAVQGTLGFGLGMVAAPVLALVDPTLVPVSLLVVTAGLPVLAAVRELGHVDWHGVGWAMLGRVPGTLVGVAAVALLPARALAVLVAVAVLVGVAANLVSWQPALTPRTLVVAGAASGATATATSIGGPPIVLVYADQPGPRVRATLSTFFAIGIVVSLGSLAVAGQVTREQVTVGLLLVPAMLVGFAVSGPLRRHVDAGRTRPAVLALVTLSAVVLLARSLLS